MKLLLDIGNSTIAWAIEDNEKIVQSSKFKYQKNDLVKQFEKNITLSKKPSTVLVSCVAEDEVIKILKEWVEDKWQLELWQACVTSGFNQLKNSYFDIQQMGVDRWLAIIAAWEKYKNALCVVDCGTAITIDLVDNTGQHLGGYIVPGVEMMQQALIANTDRIKTVVLGEVAIDSANNTQTAIGNGASLAIVAMIDRSVEILRARLGHDPKCIITGGMAEQIKPFLKTLFEYDKDLVLRGLSIMYRIYP